VVVVEVVAAGVLVVTAPPEVQAGSTVATTATSTSQRRGREVPAIRGVRVPPAPPCAAPLDGYGATTSPLPTTTTPESVTVKRARSRTGSTPTLAPSSTCTFLSRMACLTTA